MNIHRKLIILVGFGMLLIMTIAVLSLRDNAATLSRTMKGVGEVFADFQRTRTIEKSIADMSLSVHHYMETGSAKHLTSYEDARARVRGTLKDLTGQEHSQQETAILASMSADIDEMERIADRIFSRRSPLKGDRAFTAVDTAALDRLIGSTGRDIEQYQEENTLRMGRITVQLQDAKTRVNDLLIMNLIVSVMFLFALSVYLYRKVSAPLAELWKGTGEVSRGHLDYSIQVAGAHDIALLAERFNEMTLKLKQAYQELEQKLQERTHELAALDAVALTLSESRTLHDLLDRALGHLFDSMTSLEPRGGIFLCDPDNELLHLAVQRGLPPEFSRQEETIRMGECLCGMVAQTGEMLISEKSCEDPRHTRGRGANPHSHIIIPIKSRGMVHGVIFLYPGANFTLKPSDTQMLDAIGAQLGLAVENFRFYSEVKDSSEKFWDLFENARDILFTMDIEGRLTAVNKAAEDFTGYSKIELVGKNLRDFLATPAEGEAARRIFADEKATESQVIEIEAVKRDNSHAFLEISVRKLFKNQALSGFQVSARDVSEQKHMREMILKSERLGALGQLGVAVRHEINNPLTTVIGNTEILLERYEEKDKDLAVRLQSILNNALRIAEIVKRLQEIKQDKVVEYLKGVNMTDLK